MAIDFESHVTVHGGLRFGDAQSTDTGDEESEGSLESYGGLKLSMLSSNIDNGQSKFLYMGVGYAYQSNGETFLTVTPIAIKMNKTGVTFGVDIMQSSKKDSNLKNFGLSLGWSF